MEIRLKKMTLKNFKGIKDFEISLDGLDASIYGDNGTGKTTLYDAFMWLLFDEDFEISLLRELALAEEELKQKTKMEE